MQFWPVDQKSKPSKAKLVLSLSSQHPLLLSHVAFQRLEVGGLPSPVQGVHEGGLYVRSLVGHLSSQGSLPNISPWGPAGLHCFRDRATQPARQIAKVPSIASRYLLGYTGNTGVALTQTDSDALKNVGFTTMVFISTTWTPFFFQDMGLCWYVVLLGLFKKHVLSAS